MNNRYKRFFAGVLLALILSGCAENGSEADNEKIPTVDVATTPEVAAETTPKELLELLARALEEGDGQAAAAMTDQSTPIGKLTGQNFAILAQITTATKQFKDAAVVKFGPEANAVLVEIFSETPASQFRAMIERAEITVNGPIATATVPGFATTDMVKKGERWLLSGGNDTVAKRKTIHTGSKVMKTFLANLNDHSIIENAQNLDELKEILIKKQADGQASFAAPPE